MAVYFSVPNADTLHCKTIDRFLGIDYSNDPGNVAMSQSPYAPNMIRDVPGKVRKCMGYQRMAEYDGRINGVHTLRTADGSCMVLHAGTTLYDKTDGTVLYDGMANKRSRGVQLQEALWLLDGEQLLKVWQEDGALKAAPAAESAYVPTLTISKDPGGGGQAYEALNLLQPRFTETFFGDGESTEYHLSFAGLDSGAVTVTVLDTETAAWRTLTAGEDYTVDAESGIVSFAAAPAAGVGGEDNVSITAGKTFAGYAERIGRCELCILYGVNGMPDRMFASGNPDYPNRDWYSAQNDPSYWPDTGYSILGSERSAVMGYSLVDGYLAAYKDQNEPERAVILRSGTVNSDGDPVFALARALAGPGVVAKGSIAYLETEPLALTGQGVYALTTSDVTGERYSQNRSYYADGGLLKLSNLSEACAVVHNHIYWLCNGAQAYLLDGLQSMCDKNKPYSTRLYAAFHRTNLPARVMWTEQDGKELWFGDREGAVYRFYTDPESLTSYNDDGAPVGGGTGCCWTTPELSGDSFWRHKYYRWMAVLLRSGMAASVRMLGLRSGEWMLLREACPNSVPFSWENWDWSAFRWGATRENKTISYRTRLFRMARTRYRIENNKVNEPLGLMAIGLDYTEPGNRWRE